MNSSSYFGAAKHFSTCFFLAATGLPVLKNHGKIYVLMSRSEVLALPVIFVFPSSLRLFTGALMGSEDRWIWLPRSQSCKSRNRSCKVPQQSNQLGSYCSCLLFQLMRYVDMRQSMSCSFRSRLVCSSGRLIFEGTFIGNEEGIPESHPLLVLATRFGARKRSSTTRMDLALRARGSSCPDIK